MGGYLIKDEAVSSLAWAVIDALEGVLVISKKVEQWLIDEQSLPPLDCFVYDGIEASEYLTPAEDRNAWMAFVLSMARGNLADELMMTPGSSWTLISNLYSRLGVNDLLNGDDWIEFLKDCHPIILSRLAHLRGEQLQQDIFPSKETFAFHVYTKPIRHCFGR